MGLFSKSDKVRGWAQIVSTTRAPYQATSGICKMQVIVQADGIPATHVEASKMCSVKKWPEPGMVLPCELDPEKPEKFKILWDEVETWAEQSRRQAAMMAQQMNQNPGQPGMGGGPGMAGGQAQIVNLSGEAPDPAKIAKLEQMLGRDLDGDGGIGTVGGVAAGLIPGTSMPGQGLAPPPAGPPPASPDDRVAALERLAVLREKGLLTDAEFAAEKQRILGS